jgi:hypothetical protein
MNAKSIADLLRQHGLRAEITGDTVETDDIYVTRDLVTHCEPKRFAAGTTLSEILAWLGY